MLQVRKELKLGLGIGVAVLGVAAVYGGLAMMTSKSGEQSAQNESGGTSLAAEDGTSRSALNEAVGGLPPLETAPAETKEPAVAQTSVDPFSESYRNDGSTTDPWALALKTGRVAPAAGAKPIVTETPTQPLVTPTAETTFVSPPPARPLDNAPIDFALPRNDAAPVAPTAPVAAGKYVVQAGDNYSTIAGKVYGNRNLYAAIAKANPNLDPTKLKPGMEIAVPDADAVKAERASSLAKPAEAAPTLGTIDASKQYRIQPGDTLTRISQKLYGKTNQWAALYELNKGTIGGDPARLKVGTVLTLPQPPAR